MVELRKDGSTTKYTNKKNWDDNLQVVGIPTSVKLQSLVCTLSRTSLHHSSNYLNFILVCVIFVQFASQ